MDSEDDMLDTHDMESVEYDYYNDSGDDEEADYAFVEDDDEDDSTTIRSQIKSYSVLKEEDIRRHQENDIERVSMVLSITKVEATTLLLHYHWNVSKLDDEWFANEERVRRLVGILKLEPLVHGGEEELTCGICFESFPNKETVCGLHPFCSTCWTSYISTSINDGPGCLMLKCPEYPSCPSAIGQDMIEKFASKEDKEKYNRYLLRSYIEDNNRKKMKWCPAPGCENAIVFVDVSTNYDVSCLCSHSFCWNCTEEAHRPVDCTTVGRWIVKNSAESENMNWILDNSKPCPKCKRPIEKNHGCMHMTCTPPCKHEFCWLCLKPWTDHGERTGGFFACNRYEAAKKEGLYDDEDGDGKRREMAKNSIERYTHYYERWASNELSRTKAITKMEAVEVEKISEIQCVPETQLEFITEAWIQVIECRRVLKWTYAYGYYQLPDDHSKRRFFEYLQGEAESGLERLHKCVEKELEVFQYDVQGDFNQFRSKLTGLTSITKTYFENLVKALENGLVDVDSQANK